MRSLRLCVACAHSLACLATGVLLHTHHTSTFRSLPCGILLQASATRSPLPPATWLTADFRILRARVCIQPTCLAAHRRRTSTLIPSCASWLLLRPESFCSTLMRNISAPHPSTAPGLTPSSSLAMQRFNIRGTHQYDGRNRHRGSSIGACITLRCPNSHQGTRGLTSCSPETQSRQGTDLPAEAFRPCAEGPKPPGTGCIIPSFFAAVKRFLSTIDQQDMHTFINTVHNLLPAPLRPEEHKARLPKKPSSVVAHWM